MGASNAERGPMTTIGSENDLLSPRSTASSSPVLALRTSEYGSLRASSFPCISDLRSEKSAISRKNKQASSSLENLDFSSEIAASYVFIFALILALSLELEKLFCASNFPCIPSEIAASGELEGVRDSIEVRLRMSIQILRRSARVCLE